MRVDKIFLPGDVRFFPLPLRGRTGGSCVLTKFFPVTGVPGDEFFPSLTLRGGRRTVSRVTNSPLCPLWGD